MADVATITTVQEPAICIDSAKWGAAMLRWRMADFRAKAEWTAYAAIPEGHPDAKIMAELTEQSADEEAAAHDQLMEIMPAPDLAALRWKLEQLLRSDAYDGECIPAWTLEHIAQTIADVRRLLPA